MNITTRDAYSTHQGGISVSLQSADIGSSCIQHISLHCNVIKLCNVFQLFHHCLTANSALVAQFNRCAFSKRGNSAFGAGSIPCHRNIYGYANIRIDTVSADSGVVNGVTTPLRNYSSFRLQE